MPTITRTKRLVINMGNYESYATEVSVELPVETGDYLEAIMEAERVVNRSLMDDVKEAASISDVRNTYVLTWLKNREEEVNAQRTE